jgi:transposase
MTIEAVAELLTQPERRRRWTVEQKLALVAEAVRPGASMTQIARRYGISTGLLYTWRRLAQQGELSSLAPVLANSPGFIPVEIVPEIPPRVAGDEGAGVMIIELPGERRVRVDRHVDTEALRRVLAALGVAS